MSIITIQDFYDMRSRKQAELEFYHKELEKLQVKMSVIRVEMDLTNRIIDLIEREDIVDLLQMLKRDL